MCQNTKLILKSVALLYTNNKQTERKTTPFIKTTNNKTLTKQINEMNDNNFTSLKKWRSHHKMEISLMLMDR